VSALRVLHVDGERGFGGGKAVVLKLVVDLSTLAMGMCLGVAMGLLGGLIPSLSAMRLTALEALR